jgi:hypothetical protein
MAASLAASGGIETLHQLLTVKSSRVKPSCALGKFLQTASHVLMVCDCNYKKNNDFSPRHG